MLLVAWLFAGLPQAAAGDLLLASDGMPEASSAGPVAASDTKMAQDDSKHGITEINHKELPAGDVEPSLHVRVKHPEARVIAYLMLLSLVWQIGVLRFANYPEPGIRQVAAKMVCTAVAVFCAVLVNQASFSFIFDQLLTGQEGLSFGMKREEIGIFLTSAIGGGVFCWNLFFLNLGCWYYRNKPNKLMAFALVGAHMVAWSGIEAFGNLQLSTYFRHQWYEQVRLEAARSRFGHQVGFIVMVFLFFSTLFGLSSWLRKLLEKRVACHPSPDHYSNQPDAAEWIWKADDGWKPYSPEQSQQLEEAFVARGSRRKLVMSIGEVEVDIQRMMQRRVPAREGHDRYRRVRRNAPVEDASDANTHSLPLWLEEVSEAEQDAAALVLGFLTLQILVSLITKSHHVPIHGLYQVRQPVEVLKMQLSAAAFLVMLVAACAIKHFLGTSIGRSVFNFRGYLAMSMAWCFEMAGEWTMNLVWEDIWMARICSAYALSIFSMCCVLAMKSLVERTPERLRRKQAFANICNDDLEVYMYTLNRSLRQGDAATLAEASELAATAACMDSRQRRSLSRAWDQGSVDKLMNTMVSGFSVVIGLVWDIGFETAEAIIVAPGKVSGPRSLRSVGEWFVANPVYAKVALCCLLVGIVLPGWSKHIVPAARKPWRQHFEDILREQQQKVMMKVMHWANVERC